MATRVCKTFRFEAAHRLEGWPPEHKCHNMHGHSYRVEVEIEGKVNPETGVVIDFGVIAEYWKRALLPTLDHKYLNEVLGVKNSTAEYLAMWISRKFSQDMGYDGKLMYVKRVRVYETEDSYAEWS